MEITFNEKNIKIVLIDEVRPNSWNPKDIGGDEFERVKEGIKLKGLKAPIVVRENKGFEIIDGEQRWRACKELGFKKIVILNEGEVSDKEAIEMTVWYQEQVPFNQVKLASLIANLVGEHELVELPFTKMEIADMQELQSFDWDDFKNSELNEDDEENPDIKTLKIVMTAGQYEVIQQGIEKMKETLADADTSDGRSLELIIADFLSS